MRDIYNMRCVDDQTICIKKLVLAITRYRAKQASDETCH